MSEYAAICIGKRNIRILCADIAKNKQIIVRKAVQINQTDEFVQETKLCSINKLVELICDNLKSNDISCKKLLLCSSFLGGETSLHIEPPNSDISLSGILWVSGNRAKLNSGYAEDCKKYGDIYKDGNKNKSNLITTADSYLLESICQEFATYGYVVSNVQQNISADIALKQLCPHSYDSQYKLIIDISESVTAIFTYLDVPLEIRGWDIDFSRIGEQINDCIFRDIQSLHIQNPQIFISGTKLSQSEFSILKKQIENEGFETFDYQSIGHSADFAICLGTMLDFCQYGPSSLCRHRQHTTFDVWVEKYRKHIEKALVTAWSLSAVLFISAFSLMFLSQKSKAMIEMYERAVAENQRIIEDLNNNQIQLTSSVYSNDDLLLLFKLLSQTDESLSISSVDSYNMLPHIVISTDLAEQAYDEVISDGIIIRGYALNGTAVIDLQNILDSNGIRTSINGIDIAKLPNGEQIQVFELEVLK